MSNLPRIMSVIFTTTIAVVVAAAVAGDAAHGAVQGHTTLLQQQHGVWNPQPATGHEGPVPRFTIDLAQPPRARWSALAHQYKDSIVPIVDWVLDKLTPEEAKELTALFTEVDNFLPREYADEIRGVADATGLPVGQIVILNLFYELDAACTSIVAQGRDGSIYHARNLDYGIPGLQNITVDITFVNSTASPSKPVLQATTFVGYVGLLTGMKPGAFSITLDERDTNATVAANIYEFIKGAQSIAFAVRDILASPDADFEDAVEYLSTIRVMAPSYVIIGGAGPNEGAIITREREYSVDIWRMDFPKRWFLVETNYDHWKPVPAHDDRRGPAYQHMGMYNPDTVSNSTMWDVITQFSNLNSATIYSISMSASKDVYHTRTQNNHDEF